MHNIYICLLAMAIATYAIRVLPLTLIRKEITNKIHKVISVLCALCNIGGNDISGNPLQPHRVCGQV